MKISKGAAQTVDNPQPTSKNSRTNNPSRPFHNTMQRLAKALHLAQLSTFGKRANNPPAPQSPAHRAPQSPPNSPASDIVNHPYAGFSTPVRAYLLSLDIAPGEEARSERANSQRVPLAEEHDEEYVDDDHFHCLHKNDPLVDNNPHWHSGAVWSHEKATPTWHSYERPKHSSKNNLLNPVDPQSKTPPPCEGVEEVKVNMP